RRDLVHVADDSSSYDAQVQCLAWILRRRHREAPERERQRGRRQRGRGDVHGARLKPSRGDALARRTGAAAPCLSPVDGTPGTSCPFTFAAACQSVTVTVESFGCTIRRPRISRCNALQKLVQ